MNENVQFFKCIKTEMTLLLIYNRDDKFDDTYNTATLQTLHVCRWIQAIR